MTPEPVRSLSEQLVTPLARLLSLRTEAIAGISRLVAIAGIVVLGWLAYRLVVRLVHRLLRPLADDDDPMRAQRARTLGPLLSSTTRYAVAFVVLVAVLHEVGVDVRALVVSAGVLGLAVGFGAQSLVRDVITGFFILFENLIAVGDVIEVGSHVGVVEAVGLRVTKVRKFSGELRIVPNGELTAFGHHSAGWVRAVVEVAIDDGEDAVRALRLLEEVGRALREAHPADVLEVPVAEGILRFAQNELVLRLHGRVTTAARLALELEMRRRIKTVFDAHGIRFPAPELVVRLAREGQPASAALPGKESIA